MKKIFTLLAFSLAMPFSMLATSFTREVANVTEFNAALSAIGEGVNGETYTIKCTWKGSQNFKKSPVMEVKYGKVIVTSDVTNYDEMPALAALFYPVGNAGLKDDSKLSLVFENVKLNYCYGKANGKNSFMVIDKPGNIDTLAFRHCDISDITQQFVRTIPYDDVVSNINWLEFSQNRIHDCGLGTRQLVSLGHSVNTLSVTDNLFYDLPRVGCFFTMGKAGETSTAPTVYFNNNTVLVSNYSVGEDVNRSFCLLSIGDNMGAEAIYHINNNIFLAPQKFSAENMLEEGDVELGTLTEWFGVNQGTLFASHNVLDTQHYMDWEQTKLQKAEVLYMTDENPYFFSPEDAGLTDWSEGGSFQDPEKSIYYVEKSSKAYTMGIGLKDYRNVESGEPQTIAGQTTYLGASIMYVDKFPQKAAVNIAVSGPDYITYTIEPQKPTYYVNDVVTITLSDKNTPYTKLNTFKGWSDGNTETMRTITLVGDVNLTAEYEAKSNIVSAFTTFDNNRALESAQADIYLNNDSKYSATMTFMVADEDGQYAAGNGQSRPSKLDGLADDEKIPVILLSTGSNNKFTSPTCAVLKLNTKGLSKVKVEAVTGTDNNCCKKQNIEYSLDGTVFTNVASTEVTEAYKFFPIAATLPSEADDKETVYIRFVGTPGTDSNSYCLIPDEGMFYVDGALQDDVFRTYNLYEYWGGILVTADEDASGIETVQDNSANDKSSMRYNLSGQRVGKDYRGLVIMNGKKFVVK